MKKIIVDVTFELTIYANDEDKNLSSIIKEIEFNFSHPVLTGYNGVAIVDSYINDYELVSVENGFLPLHL